MVAREPKPRCAICAIAKDENRYVVEWAAYHLSLGFDHIYIYDNDSEVPLSSEFRPAGATSRVTILPWPTLFNRNAQTEAYAHFIASFGQGYEWVAIIDLDEYINLKVDRDINSFLSKFSEADGIVINWRVFGSGGETIFRPLPTIARFTRASPISFGPNGLVKSVFRPESIVGFKVHHAYYREGAIVLTADRDIMSGTDYIDPSANNLEIAQINHYFVRSKEEWQQKIQRGYTDGTQRQSCDFESYDLNEVEDRSITHRLASTKNWIRRIAKPNHPAVNLFDAIRKILS